MQEYSEKWYCNLSGLCFLHKYPIDFIDWINADDTWALTVANKNNINNISQLFILWVTENY